MSPNHDPGQRKCAVVLMHLWVLIGVLACADCSLAHKTILWLDSYSLDYDWSACGKLGPSHAGSRHTYHSYGKRQPGRAVLQAAC